MPRQQISLENLAILKSLTETELATLADLKSTAQFGTFKKILDKVSSISVSQVMFYSEEDPLKLALFKSRMRGRTRGIGMLVELILGAESEIQRRAKKGSEVKNA